MKRSPENPKQPSAEVKGSKTDANTDARPHGTDRGAVGRGAAEQADAPGFFNRWSQRKREFVEPEISESGSKNLTAPDTEGFEAGFDDPVKTAQPLAAGAAVDAEGADIPVLTDADMPDLETLNADSDYSPFFSEGVSKKLRNLALKKLFYSGKFSARDGLDDYDDDFTSFEPLGDTVTSDMKFHQRRKEKARLAKLEEERLEAERLAAADAANDPDTEKTAADDDQAGELESPQVTESSEAGQQNGTPEPEIEAQPDTEEPRYTSSGIESPLAANNADTDSAT